MSKIKTFALCPSGTGSTEDLHTYFSSDAFKRAWLAKNPDSALGFFEFLSGLDIDSVRKAFQVEAYGQLKPDPSARGKGIYLYSFNAIENCIIAAYRHHCAAKLIANQNNS